MHFFMPMKPPTVTHQEKKIRVVSGKPVVYEPAELKAAREKLTAAVAAYAPAEPFTGPLRLDTKWIWPGKTTAWKITKPDTDNLIKLLKDCMTCVGFWKDDAQVCCEITEKFTGALPGIYVEVDRIE